MVTNTNKISRKGRLLRLCDTLETLAFKLEGQKKTEQEILDEIKKTDALSLMKGPFREQRALKILINGLVYEAEPNVNLVISAEREYRFPGEVYVFKRKNVYHD